MKAFIVLALVGILVALGSAGVFMLRRTRSDEPGASRDAKMARALAVRVGLSIALFLFVLFAYWMGWVQPSGLPVNR